MGSRELPAVLRHVRVLFGAGAAGGASDGELLDRFRRLGGTPEGEAAFGVLVARHGPMVLGVCRRTLRDPDDAADAFQATFLILVRKVDSVHVEGSLGRWLYGVSRRVSARARAQADRRAARERCEPGPEPAARAPHDEAERREFLAALDEEVASLPGPFRAAIVLCDLGGLTHEAAAEQLGCPVGTIESRLSRGRKRLRERLARRGLDPPLAVSAGLRASMVPESLSLSTSNAASGAASVSASVSTLVQGVITELAWTKIKLLTLGLAAVAGACGLGLAAAQRLRAEDNPRRVTARPAAAREKTAPEVAGIRLQPPAPAKPGDYLIIEVLEALPGRPISGTRVVRPDGTISLGFYGDLKVAGLNRQEIKEKLVEHLRKWIRDEVLGLQAQDEDGKWHDVAPKDSNRVFVDDSVNFEDILAHRPRVSEDDKKLDRILEAVEAQSVMMRRAAAGGRPESETAQRLADHDRRLNEIEFKLDRLIQAIESLKGEGRR
jgi:RNA polymerase sigma factor (sigma-70 family)